MVASCRSFSMADNNSCRRVESVSGFLAMNVSVPPGRAGRLRDYQGLMTRRRQPDCGNCGIEETCTSGQFRF
jgi:hypothetical protein